jgi:UDP:flavonoid glycosyltransferase YjiC (YdhE family)
MSAVRHIMRILVATLGSYGDVYPFIALATVLKKRGHDNAARLRRLGVGDWLSPHRYRADAVADRLQRLLTAPAVAERCREIAGRFEETQPLLEASELIEAMLESSPLRSGWLPREDERE